MYLYKGEEQMLKETFDVTYSEDEFNNSDKVIIGHFTSESMGTNQSKADYIIWMNIPYSATVFMQAQDRGLQRGKTINSELVWLFSNNGIEKNIYGKVTNKIDYSLSHFKDEYLKD